MATFDDDMNYNPNSPPTGESTVDDITGTDDDLMLLDQEDRIQLAIAAYGAAKETPTGTKMSLRAVAKHFRVPRSTLKRRINGVPTRSDGHEHERKVSSTAEAVLKEMLKTLAHRGTPVTPNFVNDYASVLAGAPVGETYAKRFLARHPDLAVKFANPLEEVRARALSRPVVSLYMEMLGIIMRDFKIKPKNIWNMDEKGVQLGNVGKIKVIVDRNQRTIQNIQDGSRDLITIIEAVPAEGEPMRSSVIYAGVRRDLRWAEENPYAASLSLSPNGWTDQELGSTWLEKDFATQTAERLDSPDDYRLLILDGHNSHITYRFVDFARRHRIIVVCLPAHTTHALQPLDVGIFGPLSKKWKSLVNELHTRHILITKYNFLKYYGQARASAFTEKNLRSAFRTTGIHPYNPDAIPDKAYEPAKTYTTQASLPVPAPVPAVVTPAPSTSSSAGTILSTPTSSSTTSPSPTTSAISSGASAANDRPSTPPRPSSAASSDTRALYRVLMPSPLRTNPTRAALEAENAELRRLLQAAGTQLEASQARELLADKENGRLREALFAKKNKPKRGKFSTAHARLMTSDEMVGALLLEFQKKLMAELHKGMKTALAAAKKKVVDEEKRLREEKKQAEKAARPARGRGRGRGTGGRGAGGRGAGGRGRGSGRGGRGGGTRSRRRHADEDSDDETPSPSESEGCASDDTASSPDTEDPTPRRRGTRLRSQAAAQDEATVSDLPASEGDEDIDSNGDEDVDLEEEEASEVELEAERSDIESDGEETGVLAVNGHRWRDGNVEFQVLWEDGDCTWEPLATVDDCAALDDYLAGRDVEDALRLPKRQYRINTQLELTHP